VLEIRPGDSFAPVMREFLKSKSPEAAGLSFMGIDVSSIRRLSIQLNRRGGIQQGWLISCSTRTNMNPVRVAQTWNRKRTKKEGAPGLPQPDSDFNADIYPLKERGAPGDDPGALCAIRPDLVLLGSRIIVPFTIEMHKAGWPVEYGNRMRVALALAERDADVVFAAVPDQIGDDKWGNYRFPFYSAPFAMSETVESIVVSLKARDGFDLTVILVATTEDDAATMQHAIAKVISRKVLDERGVGNASVSRTGKRVVITAKLKPDIVHQGDSPASILQVVTSKKIQLLPALWDLVETVN
ncbi:MAG: hypothetical protein ACYTFI_08880, partial [Planctomycetota bacterium]